MSASPDRPAQRRRNLSAFAAVGAATLMLGLSFAAVPLYRLFCAVTGYGGTTQVAKAAPAEQGARRIAVRFDGNVAAGLPWKFTPETREITVRTGETATIFYKVTNESDQPATGMATYNVSPDQTGSYFNKIACFCFNEQTLAPRETAEWPVVFFLDPALEKDETMANVEAVTLSYTFFARPRPAAEASALKPKT